MSYRRGGSIPRARDTMQSVCPHLSRNTHELILSHICAWFYRSENQNSTHTKPRWLLIKQACRCSRIQRGHAPRANPSRQAAKRSESRLWVRKLPATTRPHLITNKEPEATSFHNASLLAVRQRFANSSNPCDLNCENKKSSTSIIHFRIIKITHLQS